jgi:hypothetical protein
MWLGEVSVHIRMALSILKMFGTAKFIENSNEISSSRKERNCGAK